MSNAGVAMPTIAERQAPGGHASRPSTRPGFAWAQEMEAPSAMRAAAIRTVLADDHDLVRSGLRLLLEQVPGVEVVSEASTGAELLAEVQRCKPDLVVTDISMPGMDGLAALAQMRGLATPPRVLVVSMHDAADFMRRALNLGAAGYLMKEGSAMELAKAVGTIMQGHTYLSAQVSQRLQEKEEPSPEELLTARQLEILVLIAKGGATKEVAFQLGLSPKTVDVHRARIMERVGIADVVRLTLYCVRHGLVLP